ncbi:MAG: hypothetical protein IKO48_07140 [Elusimicrobia bacterium]|nr:hypothetical protein [Elusimicrobiota bacterium]
MEKPFNVSDDKTNTLFNILFKNVQDKNFKLFDNKTDDEILSVLDNGNVGFNRVDGNVFLCLNDSGSLKKIDFSGSARDIYITEQYWNDGSWYRVWSNGFIEQGGIATNTGSMTKKTVNLLKPFSDNKYTLIFGVSNNYDNNQRWSETVKSTDKATDNFKTVGYGVNVGYTGSWSSNDTKYIANSFSWYACGK